VDTSPGNKLTPTSAEAQFFLQLLKPPQRQYEALRAYFVDGLPSTEIAERFGYSAGSFRVLCHQFRHDAEREQRYFRDVRRGPQAAPARDRVRELVIGMRKRNLSVYDIQQELRTQDHDLSINSLSILLREEGFARLPRRADDERPATTKPETEEAAATVHAHANVGGLDT
jgi:transposase